MDILFVHNNFPGQFKHLALHLTASPAHRVAAIGSPTAGEVRGVTLQRYSAPEATPEGVHSFARRFDGECRRAEQVLYAANSLKASGFRPQVIFAHPGWGEALPLKRAFPDAKLCIYAEFFYSPQGADVGFDPEFCQFGADGLVRIALRNAATLLALSECDVAIAPTEWQRSLFPPEFRSKIRVIHDGIDAQRLTPRETTFRHASLKRPLTAQDEVITYVARSLEPYRGFHIFMRALPELMAARPVAQICIVGDAGVSYGSPPEQAESWKALLLSEVGAKLDSTRIHFLGHLPYDEYVNLLRVSRAHTYLTYPFVLSWSLIEAMALGCLVVASDTEPVREVIRDHVNGLMVPFFDPSALAQTIALAARDPRRFDAVRRAARDTVVTRYDFARVSRPQFDTLLDELAPGGRQPPARARARPQMRDVPRPLLASAARAMSLPIS